MLGFIFIDPMYLIMVMVPGMLIGGIATWRVKSAFARGKEIPQGRGMSGAQVAQAILDANHIRDVRIEPVQGYLSDHYDPRAKVLRLSPEVYGGRSLAAAGVAAHEVGHAIQHARGYAPLTVRNAIVPVASFGSSASYIIIMVGMVMGATQWIALGALLFAAVVVFQIVNLPVEFNASSRARETLVVNGIVSSQEDREVGKVLNAAAMTYVAATITSLLTLAYFLMRAGLLGGRDD